MVQDGGPEVVIVLANISVHPIYPDCMEKISQVYAIKPTFIDWSIDFLFTNPFSVLGVYIHYVIVDSILSFFNLVFIKWNYGGNVGVLTHKHTFGNVNSSLDGQVP